MDSPINPAVWRFLFHGAVATLSAASLLSLYHEKHRALSSLDAAFSAIGAADSATARVAAVASLSARLSSDAAGGRGLTRLAAQRHGRPLLRLLTSEDEDTRRAALRLLQDVFCADADGRRRLAALRGPRALLAALSDAHRGGRAAEALGAAEALCAATDFPEAAVVLRADVPAGAEGAAALAQMPAAARMLRVLDPQAPTAFLRAAAGTLAHVSALRAGADRLQEGAEVFVALLAHADAAVVEHAARAIRHLARAGRAHDVLARAETLRRIAENFRVNADPNVLRSCVTIILVMLDSAHGEAFFTHLAKETDMLRTIFEIWCHAADKTLRDRARLLAQLLARVAPCEAQVQSYMERYRTQIAERRSKDEEEVRRREMQQMRQQQMMQQMMLGGMGNGMDLSELMGE